MLRTGAIGAMLLLLLLSALTGAEAPVRAPVLQASTPSANVDGVTIVYPGPLKPGDKRTHYPAMLLELALSYSDTKYQIIFSESEMLQRRALTQLAQGEGIDVTASMTSHEREGVLLPIRIPIYKGLIGWRLALISQQAPVIFEPIRNLRQLQGLLAGQVHDWPDTQILKDNGIKVHAGSNYSGLFKMLSQRRIDYFPRSVVEIWSELEGREHQKLMVDPYVLIYYPTAYYFFVNKSNRVLADAIEKGLEQSIEDGSFDALFYRHHQDYLNRIELNSRRVIVLENTTLPEKTPLTRTNLWIPKPANVSVN